MLSLAEYQRIDDQMESVPLRVFGSDGLLHRDRQE